MSANITFKSDTELLAGYMIWMVVSPLVVLFGVFGNVVSIIVLCRRQLYKKVTSVILIALSFTDLLTLMGGVVTAWIAQLSGRDLTVVSSLGCKIYMMNLHLVRDVSAWILVSITVERVIATTFPHRYKRICTRRSACIIIVTIVLFSFALNCHFLFGYAVAVVAQGNGTLVKVCVPTRQHKTFMQVWPILHLIKSSLLPVSLMVVGSLWISLVLVKHNIRLRAQVAPADTTGSSALGRVPAMSRLLVTLNMAFICTTAPVFFYQSLTPFVYTINIPWIVKLCDPLLACLILLNNVNCIINFLLYCFTGIRFRLELKAMVRSWCQ